MAPAPIPPLALPLAAEAFILHCTATVALAPATALAHWPRATPLPCPRGFGTAFGCGSLYSAPHCNGGTGTGNGGTGCRSKGSNLGMWWGPWNHFEVFGDVLGGKLTPNRGPITDRKSTETALCAGTRFCRFSVGPRGLIWGCGGDFGGILRCLGTSWEDKLTSLCKFPFNFALQIPLDDSFLRFRPNVPLGVHFSLSFPNFFQR